MMCFQGATATQASVLRGLGVLSWSFVMCWIEWVVELDSFGGSWYLVFLIFAYLP